MVLNDAPAIDRHFAERQLRRRLIDPAGWIAQLVAAPFTGPASAAAAV
jgi:hypothetical protein